MTEELINKLFEYLQRTEVFILDQAPDFIQQLLRYKKITAVIDVTILSVVVLGALAFSMYNIYNPTIDKHGDRSTGSQFCCFMPIIVAFMFFAPLLGEIADLMKIHIAPKVYLLEYFKSLKE